MNTIWIVMEMMDGCVLSKMLEFNMSTPMTEPQMARVVSNVRQLLIVLVFRS